MHCDASCLNKDQARSSHRGFPLGWKQGDPETLQLNRRVLAAAGAFKLVAASAAKSELGGLFCDDQDATIMCLALTKMGWP